MEKDLMLDEAQKMMIAKLAEGAMAYAALDVLLPHLYDSGRISSEVYDAIKTAMTGAERYVLGHVTPPNRPN